MMIKKWFSRLTSPKLFYETTTSWVIPIGIITFILLCSGSIWALVFSPEDFQQGNSYRIMYIHVPASFVALASYYAMAISGAIYLIWRIKLADVFLRSLAGVGAVMTVIALFTGSIWGKPTWGVWWVWDARISSMLILLFLYLGIIALYESFDGNTALAAKLTSLLALVGTVNIPIIYKSVDWWYTLHQPASIKLTGESTIHSSMWWPLVLMILGFYFFVGLATLLSMRAEVLVREKNSRWVKVILGVPHVK